jgi:hypothetical protein
VIVGARALGVLALTGLVVACSKFSSEEQGAVDAGAEGGASDGSTDGPDDGALGADGADGGFATVSDTFDDGCAGWAFKNVTPTTSSSSHTTPGSSCKLCSVSAGDAFASRSFDLSPGDVGTYDVTVWAQAANPATSGKLAFLGIRFFDGTGKQLGDVTTQILLSSVWATTTTTHDSGAKAASVEVDLQLNGNGDCVEFDDMVLSKR